MPLVSMPAEEVRRAPWRVAAVSIAAVVVSIVLIAIVARCTRDRSAPIPGREQADVGAPPVIDAGMPEPDAGHREDDVSTLRPDVDAGPVFVPEADLPPSRVREALQPLFDECLKAALRFDPSLGGRARVTAEISASGNSLRLKDALSPVLAKCLEDRAHALQVEGASAPARFELWVRFDGLRATAMIDDVTPVE